MKILAIDREQLARRILGQAFLDGTSVYWTRRAERFEAELRRPPDRSHPSVHQPTAAERAERERRLAAQAAACRCAARFYAEFMHVDDLVADVWADIDGVMAEEELSTAVDSQGA